MKKKIRFIVNPRSGIRKRQRIERLIEAEIDKDLLDYDIVHTQYAGHATLIAKEAVAQGFDIVVAVGGDGSVNEVAAGLIGTNVILGMLPAGSGNGFAMHLGWGRNITSVLHRLPSAGVEKVDTCTINGRPFVNLAGVGFEASVAHHIKSVEKRGFQAYFKLSFGSFFSYKTKSYKVKIDNDFEKKVEALNITVANGPMYGYNFVIAPLAKHNDGQLEVIVLLKAAWWRYITNFYRFFNQSFHKSSIVERYSGKRIEIELSEPDYAQCDGEGFPVELNSVVFTVNPLSLHILVPPKDAQAETLSKKKNIGAVKQ